MHRRALLGGGGALALQFAASGAGAQTWQPDRPVRLLIGFPPGGASDAAVRILQPALQARLGQPVIIDNRAGGGGNIAAEAVARAAPDGTTILSANMGTLAVNPALMKAMPFDAERDLAPVTLIFNAVNVLVCPAGKPFRSVADIIAAARARPGQVTYGTGGVGSAGHLCGLLLDHVAGTKMEAVPYRGGGPQMLALLAGEHDFGFSPMGTVTEAVAAGRIRALAVATKSRAAELPSVPTMIEAGLPDFEVLNYDGILVPRATPGAVQERLGAAIRDALADLTVASEFRKRGLEPWPSTAAAYSAQLASDAAKWQPLIRAAGIQPS